MPSPHTEKHDDGDDTLLQDLALDSDGSGNDDEKRSNDQNDNVDRTTASLVKVINQVQDSLKSDKENAKSHNHSIIKVPLILQKMQKKLRLSSRQLADARSTFMSHAAELHANDSEDTPQEQKLLLDLQELEKAIADLGVYPSHQEVEDMHRTLGHGHARDFVDLPEYLEMVKALTLADIKPETRLELHRLYAKTCDADRMLSRKGLADLLNLLGHPEREEELDSLMLDWDAHHRGKVTFGSFLSIVAGIMKAEEIQVQLETDFKRFNPEFCQKSLSSSCPLQRAKDLLAYQITQQDLMRVHNEVGFPITSALTQEMLFDADTSGDGGVSYDELICTVELVGTDEVHEAMEAAGRKFGGAVLPTAKATRITKAPGSRD
jgi:Ca2+-binding EF-hand superfamily protein